MAHPTAFGLCLAIDRHYKLDDLERSRAMGGEGDGRRIDRTRLPQHRR
jgi:hypothetical protein